LFVILVAGFGFTSWSTLPVLAACTIGGTVYRDYNANGVQDANESLQVGIVVTAYDRAGAAVATDTTDAAGAYTLNVGGTPPQVRVEFGIPQTFLRSGPFGTAGASPTTVTFVNCVGNVPLNFGVVNPGQYCHTPTPDLATSCFVFGDPNDPAVVNQPALISFPYNAGSNNAGGPFGAGSPYDAPPHPVEALTPQLGSVLGLAHHRASDSWFVSAFIKRHSDVLLNRTGAIYRITRNPNTITLFANLTATTGANPRLAPVDYLHDSGAYDAIGKLGLGGMDISDDDRFLFVVNLNTRALMRVPIANPAAVTSIPIPSPGCTNGQHRPFGVSADDNFIHIGVVCDASTGTVANLTAHVMRYDAATGVMNPAPIFSMNMNYPRRCVDSAPGCGPGGSRNALWQPWISTWPAARVAQSGSFVYPQPMLTDIEFDGNGDLILGFRDRAGDMFGNGTPGPDPLDNVLRQAIGGGDIIRACVNGAGGWTLEDNAQCGAVTTGGNAGNFIGQGPGNPGGEYYYQENNALYPYANRHDEIVMGGMFMFPGAPDVTVTAFDPVPADNQLFDGGIIWLNNQTGQRARSYRIFNGTFGGLPLFGKANGLGELEAACGPAPLEIGNRVWEDLDRNGQQDPTEQPLANVIVTLYAGPDTTGAVLATAVTNAAGEYIFRGRRPGEVGGLPGYVGEVTTFADLNNNAVRDPNEPLGILPDTTYTVALNDTGNYTTGANVLAPYYATPADLVPNQRDSDGIVTTNPNVLVSAANFPRVTLRTGTFGENDHTYDFGFSLQPPPRITPTPPTPGGGSGCELGLSKAVSTPFAGPGDTVIWTITVTNPCPTTATNLTVVDTMPPGVNIISVSPNGSINGQTVTVTIPSIPPGGTVVITITTQIDPNITVPFSLENDARLGNLRAKARVLSVGRLPNTGYSPWNGSQLALVTLALGLIGLFGVALYRTRRR
jgi:uncharacterized repeat protein (TIGR01451 family)